MKTKQIIFAALLISLCQFTSAQVREGVHYAFEIKKGQKIPDVITVTVVSHDDFCKKFINNKTKSLLEGKFFIAEKEKASYYVGNFSKGIPDGEWEAHSWDEKSNKTAYINGKIEGDFYKYNADGTPYSGKSYKAGYLRHSISRHRNGKILEETYYDEKGHMHGRRVRYSQEGKLIDDETYEHGEKHGKFYEYDETLGRTREQEYKNGKILHDKRTDANGNIEYEAFYNEEGKHHGKTIQTKNGKIHQEQQHNNGIIQEEKTYFEDGNIKSIHSYDENGQKKYTAYYHNNPYYIKEEHNYLDGEIHGMQKMFDRKDILSKETYYYKGDRIYEKYYDRDSGKIQSLYIVDETGHLTKVEEYNSKGTKTYKNKEYKKPASIKLTENASGIIDIEIE